MKPRAMRRAAGGLATAVLLAAAAAHGAGAFPRRPTLTRTGQTFTVDFAVPAATDVEVAILDARGRVVRHLAAGVLGDRPPPPLVAGSLSQKLPWDGRDDFGVPVGDPSGLSVRVRAGMSVRLERIVGGDPYAYYSRQMGQGDHAKWKITGLEVKPDGTVYVLGNATHIGPPALRQYDADGNYLRTVFPPPAGKPVEKMKGWGINVKADGTYSPKCNDLITPAVTTTLMTDQRARLANLFPCRDNDRLILRDNEFRMMTIHTDGTIPPEARLPGRLVNEPSLFHPETNGWKVPWRVGGPVFTCLSPDGKHFYLSGLYAGTIERLRRVGAERTGFWRDGQVYKVDLATRKAEVFFALDAGKVLSTPADRARSPIGDSRFSYAALHGVAADSDNHVFVCDRQNQRVLVLSGTGEIERELPVSHADDVALDPGSKALYVITRDADYGGGELKLLKFADWSADVKPSIVLPLGPARETYADFHHAFVAACRSAGRVNVWVAYRDLPVRVYRDDGAKFSLVKDFYEAGPQRCLDLARIVVDRKTETVYVPDAFGNCFRLSDWEKPAFSLCMTGARTPLRAMDLAVDPRGPYVYACSYKAWEAPISRYKPEGGHLTPAPLPGTADPVIAPRIFVHWAIGIGQIDAGYAVGPDGNLAALTRHKGSTHTTLSYFRMDSPKPSWDLDGFDRRPSGCVRFDPQGNLYVGIVNGRPNGIPAGFEHDEDYARYIGRIRKYSPTGSLADGDLFPRAPAAPVRTYDVHFGHLQGRPAQFSVDGYGRIYYPTSIAQKVGVVDNAGNEILRFGTYGNRDSTGGLAGDKVPTPDIPMGLPNSVQATDDFIYVGDMMNARLLRIRKAFELEAAAKLDGP
ncbi:MAG TPA: hypothetical protein VM695_10235, partial [Phycisphaerae bacterium]|nr:hypothetical protein [Phycisphaerae bacterium]